jgi:hypothetical protein
MIACKNEDTVNMIINDIDVSSSYNRMQQVNLSLITDNISYFKLGNNDEITLADNPPFDISDNLLVTVDSEYSLAILDGSMNLIKIFGNRGRGPGEYTSISNLCFGKNNKVYFNSLTDLFEFNSDGTLSQRYTGLLQVDEDLFLNQWCIVDDSLIFGYIQNNSGSEKYKAALIDFDGNIIRFYKNNELLENQGSRVISGSPQIRIFNGTVYFKEQFNDTIFCLDTDYNLLPEYSFDLGVNKTPASVRTDFYKYYETISEYITMNDFFPIDNYILVNIDLGKRFPAKRRNSRHVEMPSTAILTNNMLETYNTTLCLGIYNIRSNEFQLCKPTSTDNPLSTSGLFNDIDAGPRFFPQKQINDSTLAMIVTVRNLKAHVESDEFKNNIPLYSEKKKQLEDFVNSLSDFDNPVLMIVTIKEK